MSRGKYDRAQSTSERQAERHEKLLDGATEVFAARGYRGTRVDDIVEHVGISRRTLYEHFDSVDAILEQVYERAVRISFTTIVQQLIGITDPIERIHAGVRSYFEMIAANPHAARVVFEEYRMAGPKQAALYELNTSRYTMLLIESLNAAFAAGRLGRAPDETTVFALIKGMEAVGIRAIHRGEHAQLASVVPLMAALVIETFRLPHPMQ
jgi:AcrR family transcriptional regulator